MKKKYVIISAIAIMIIVVLIVTLASSKKGRKQEDVPTKTETELRREKEFKEYKEKLIEKREKSRKIVEKIEKEKSKQHETILEKIDKLSKISGAEKRLPLIKEIVELSIENGEFDYLREISQRLATELNKKDEKIYYYQLKVIVLNEDELLQIREDFENDIENGLIKKDELQKEVEAMLSELESMVDKPLEEPKESTE